MSRHGTHSATVPTMQDSIEAYTCVVHLYVQVPGFDPLPSDNPSLMTGLRPIIRSVV
jgi:hypothetical protein